LGTETVLPGVSDGTGAAASEGLHMFVTISLGPTRDRRGRPYFRSGAGLAVGVVPACGSWLLDVANDDGSALTATEEAYRLVITPQGELAPASTPGRGSRTGAGDTGSGTDSGPKEAPPVLPRASTPGSEVTISRRTGLPTAARAERKPGETIILTLTNREPVTAFKAPPWVGKPPADARARDLALPPQQRRKAAYKAWTYYVARCTKYLAREPKWKEALEKKRKHMVVTLADQAEALWRVQGQGSGGEIAAPRGTSPAGFLSVLGGAYRETERRFLYVKETDPTKARAIARQYALEAIQRRDEMLKDALDKMIERFGQDVRREAARTGPAEAAVSAQLLTIVRDAVRASYVRRAPDLIAGQLMTRRSGTR